MEKTNKLIAEFMGYIYEDDRFFMEDSKGVRVYENLHHELKYDSSWDWLMPVIEKIQDKHLENPELDYWSVDEIRLAVPNIQEVYYLVVEFIKDYNQNN